MIGWHDVYKVVEAMFPLYVALILGFGSVRWWHIFSPEQCNAINQLVCYFTLPLFTFEFAAHVDPFKWNYLSIGADAISKVIIAIVLVFWAKCSSKGSYCWSITSFSLSTLTNSLVVGVPLLKAMYGQEAVDLVVQFSVIQGIVWLTVLLFVLEFRQTKSDSIITESVKDIERNSHDQQLHMTTSTTTAVKSKPPSLRSLMKTVGLKLALNPNSYACFIGMAWAFVASRWKIEMPGIIDGSVTIMSKAGIGMAMFSMGLFMALQEKFMACGPSLTVFGLMLRFVAGPAAIAIAAIAVGLHGTVLRVVIIQAALPQSITSFIYAKEYGLHAEVLSTAVIIGMILSLPILVGYYAVLEFLH